MKEELVFEMLPDDFEERIQRALDNRCSGDYQVLGELAFRYADAKFYRKSLPNKDTGGTFHAKSVRACYEEHMEMRPSEDAICESNREMD